MKNRKEMKNKPINREIKYNKRERNLTYFVDSTFTIHVRFLNFRAKNKPSDFPMVQAARSGATFRKQIRERAYEGERFCCVTWQPIKLTFFL